MKSVIFFHRSVGQNLINDGKVYELVVAQHKVSLSDYNQNTDTLTTDLGAVTHPGFNFPGANTTPADYAQIFTDNVAIEFEPIRALALQHDVIVIKSCYPNSHITSDEQLEVIKGHYISITQFFAVQPTKQLVLVTSPPLTPLRTNKAAAARARQLSAWLVAEPFASSVHVFNLFDLLAAPQGERQANRLCKEYRRRLPVNSHPNAQASKVIAPKFIALL